MTSTGVHTLGIRHLTEAGPGDRWSPPTLSGQDAPGVIARLSDDLERLALTDLTLAQAAAPRLVALAETVANPAARARARRALAQTYAYANRFPEALLALERAIGEAEQAGDRLEAARARMTTMHALARLGRFCESADAGEQARATFAAAGESLLAARADINLGVVRRMQDNPRAALDHFERARAVVHDHPMLAAQLESNRAEALLDLYDFDGAERSFVSARAAFQTAGAVRAEGIAEGNLGDLAARQGRLQAAMVHFERARRLLGETDAPGDVARLCIEEAEVLTGIGLYREASESLAGALPVLRGRGMSAELARALVVQADAAAHQDRDDEAFAALREADDLYRAAGNATGRARVSSILAEMNLAAARADEAFADTARAIENSADRPGAAAAAHLLAARALESLGRHTEAMDHIERALPVAERLGLAPLHADLLHARARRRHAAGDLAGARADVGNAVRQIGRVRGVLRSSWSRSAFLGGRVGIFADAASYELDDTGDPGSVDRAFAYIEAAKGRSLQELVADAGARDADARPEPRADRALEDELAALHGELRALYATTEHGPRRTGDREDSLVAQIRRREDRAGLIEQRLASMGGRVIYAEPCPLAALRASVPAGTGVVEFFEESGDFSAIVVTRDRVRVRRRFTPVEEVRDRLKDVLFQVDRAIVRGMPGGPLGARLARDAESVLADLRRVLMEPIEADLREANRRIIVPCSGLFGVPFHALVGAGDGAAGTPPTTTFAPSATVALGLRGLEPGAGARPLVVGVSDPAIPGAEEEAAIVAGQLPGAEVLLGHRATLDAVRAAVPGRSVIHFATHARFVATHPQASGVRLADGWLSAWEISRLSLGGARVVLSGCETGRAQVQAGDEIIGLARAFLSAGASALILSLWTLHDRSALEMSGNLYSRWYALAGGTTAGLSIALRDAQTERRVRGEHVASWASFFMIGPI